MKKGLTLIEILIVIGILAILFSIIIIAINPARQLAQGRNTQRRSDVEAILNAIQQRIIDNNGDFNEGYSCDPLPEEPKLITSVNDPDYVDLCGCLVETYLAEMPYDTAYDSARYSSCHDYFSGYTVSQNAYTGRITVSAEEAELNETISVTR